MYVGIQCLFKSLIWPIRAILPDLYQWLVARKPCAFTGYKVVASSLDAHACEIEILVLIWFHISDDGVCKTSCRGCWQTI